MISKRKYTGVKYLYLIKQEKVFLYFFFHYFLKVNLSRESCHRSIPAANPQFKTFVLFKVQASLAANTFAVTGHAENKRELKHFLYNSMLFCLFWKFRFVQGETTYLIDHIKYKVKIKN